tara:strand:- start:1585 stop:2070 length:486 start_codon:yes stop_codon:yes gene_type:complete
MFSFTLVVNLILTKYFLVEITDNYKMTIEKLVVHNRQLNEKIEEIESIGLQVTVTMYEPVSYQTDSTPNILADGTRIRTQKASEYRFIAVSRNLLKRWGGPLDYGDFVILRNTQSHKDGLYQVRDTMNPRWVNRIDILETPGTPPYRLVGEILIADMEKNT